MEIHNAKTHSKGDFVLKNQFKAFVLKFTDIQKKSDKKYIFLHLLFRTNFSF